MSVTTNGPRGERRIARLPPQRGDPQPRATDKAGPAAVLLALVTALMGRLGKWDVIHNAIADTPSTIRLCAVLVAAAIPPGVVALTIALLARHN